jgi:thioester reductase-like protein
VSRLFITGATGFLGGELAVALSKLDSIEKIFCLIRTRNDEDAVARLKQVFALHGDYFNREKVVPIRADLADPDLVDRLTANEAVRDISVVIHCAANTSFLQQKTAAIMEANIGGTQRIVQWALSLSNLKTFAYVGTATIAGAGAAVVGKTIYEGDAPDPGAKHLVAYTRSKMFAEMAVAQAIPAEKLLILRPSILLGDSRCIVPRSFDIAWIIVAFRYLRMCFCDPDSECDVIPVDYAVKAIVSLLMSRRRHSTYHVSGGAAATTPRKIGKLIDYYDPSLPDVTFCPREHLELVKKWLRTGECLPSELRPYSDHLEHINATVGRKNARMLLAGLDAYWQFIDLNQRFDNSRMLADARIGLPEPAHVYLKRTAPYLHDIDPLQAAVNP